MPINIRPIKPADDAGLSKIIKDSFIEFNAPLVGTVYSDPETDHLSEVFRTNGSAYFVAEENGQLFGGCGIYPTTGLPEGCAELVKFYLSPAARSKGIGRLLMEHCIAIATQLGYREIYLESFPELAKAVGMYEKAGFKMIHARMGNSGHYAANVWMLKKL